MKPQPTNESHLKLPVHGILRPTRNLGLLSRPGGFEGPNTPATNNSPLREGKGWLYEGGVRVPFIVRAPKSAAARGIIVSRKAMPRHSCWAAIFNA